MVVCVGTSGVAQAISLDTGESGVDLRWDNTLRYNLGMRTDSRDSAIYGNANSDESDAKFDQGDIVTSRFDLLSEVDGSYDSGFGRIGARVSGAGWYDFAYDDKVKFNPAITQGEDEAPDGARVQTSYEGDRYSQYTKKYYLRGAELLDAFAFINSNIGGMPFSIKAGRHSLYWGESLFFGGQSISYSQQPIDGLKASTSPGIETKEVFLPLAQISATFQPAPELTLAFEYFLEWDANRLPEGGTYFGVSDFLFQGPDRFGLAPVGTADSLNGLPDCNPSACAIGHYAGTPAFADSARRLDPAKPSDSGDIGANARWSPAWADGTLGIYYRRFDERVSWAGLKFGDVAVGFVPELLGGPGLVAIPTTYQLLYPQNTELYGLSYTRNIGVASVAAEVTLRKNTALNNALPSSVTGSSFGADGEGPRGDLTTALINTVILLPSTPVWETGTLIAEIAWSHLNSVSSNAGNYSGVGYAGCNPSGLPGGTAGDKWDGCSTRDFVGAQINFEPQWLQAFPGVDLAMPLSYFTGIVGNKQDNGDGFQGSMRYSAGISADLYQRYKVTLAYNDSYAHVGAAEPYSTRDRGWVSLTAKASF